MSQTTAPQHVTPLAEIGGRAAQEYRNALDAFRPLFEHALGGRMSVDHFIEVATTAFLSSPKLRECSPLSVMRALLKAAQMGLRPDGEEAALVPYKGEAEFQPMFKGIVRTLLRTRTVRKIEARVVKTGDQFEYAYGLAPILRHTPAPDQQRGETTHAYAIAWLASGDTQFEVMDRGQLDAIQREVERQRRGSTPAWEQQPDEMRRKIVVKRLAKYLEMDPEQAAVIAYDNALDAGRRVEPADLNPAWETREWDERVRAHAERQTAELAAAVERISSAPTPSSPALLDQRVGFGMHRDKTWGELIEQHRGYLTHFVLTDACRAVPQKLKDELRALVGTSAEAPKPDAATLAALQQRGTAALARLRADGMDDQEWGDAASELALLAHEGNLHGLADAVDALERRAGGKVQSGDLFSSQEG